MYFLNSFFIYSILGYIFETIGGIITKTNYKSGILHGPWTPIYGIGVVVILLLSNYFFKNLHMPRWKETIIVIIILAVFLTCLEAIGGILIEKTSGIVFWDYSDKALVKWSIRPETPWFNADPLAALDDREIGIWFKQFEEVVWDAK